MTQAQDLTDQRKLEAILRLNQLLSFSMKTDDVLEGAMQGLEEFLRAKDSSIYEVDYEKGELFFRVARGSMGQKLLDKRVKIGTGVAGWVAKTGQPHIVSRAEADEHFFDGFDRELGYHTESMLTAPLISKGVVIGVAQLINRIDGGRFTQADLELARMMAGQIAVALENAKLYARLEEKHRFTQEELARTQDALIKSERQAALSGLAHGIAHQIRNPTMSIGGFARRILEKTAPDQHSQRRYAEVIINETARLEKLVEQVRFLTETKIQPVLTEINPVLTRAVTECEQAGLTWEWELGDNLPRVWLDAKIMKVALKEVIKNSVEAGASKVLVRSRILDDQVVVEIIDNGTGLTEEDLAAALDPFYSTRAQNLGLGLSVVNHILQEHKGGIRLSSAPGRGAMVTLTIPLTMPQG